MVSIMHSVAVAVAMLAGYAAPQFVSPDNPPPSTEAPAIGSNGCPLPDAVRVTLDFSTAEEAASTLSVMDNVFAPNLEVLVTATALRSAAGSPQRVRIFDTDASGTADEDLEIDMGNALIIQEETPGNPEGPPAPAPADDRVRGGLLNLLFEPNTPTTAIAVMSMKFADTDNMQRMSQFKTTVMYNGMDESVIQDIPMTPDMGVVEVPVMDQRGGLRAIEIWFNRMSGALLEMDVCVRTSTMNGDPHVHRYGSGETRDIYLPPGEWVDMFAGPRYVLQGRVFERPGFVPGRDTLPAEWFDGIAIIERGDDGSSVTVVNVTMPHDATVGHVNDGTKEPRINYFRVEVGGRVVGASNATYATEDGQVHLLAKKLTTSVLEGALDDALTIETPDFAFVLQNAKVSNKHLFSDEAERLTETHLDIDFLRLDPETIHGPLVDLIFKPDEELSETARQWENKANAYAVAGMS